MAVDSIVFFRLHHQRRHRPQFGVVLQRDGAELGRESTNPSSWIMWKWDANSKIKKAIIDKHNVIPPETQIGIDPNEDRKRFDVTPRGIVVVPKGYFKAES